MPREVVAIMRRVRRRLRAARADQRGIALQTVIIMVVLVVIGGAVAAVLVNRAGTETTRLEQVDSELDADQYPNEALCRMGGHTWTPTTGPCVPTTTPPPTPTSPDSAYTAANTQAACDALNPRGTFDGTQADGSKCTKPSG